MERGGESGRLPPFRNGHGWSDQTISRQSVEKPALCDMLEDFLNNLLEREVDIKSSIGAAVEGGVVLASTSG